MYERIRILTHLINRRQDNFCKGIFNKTSFPFVTKFCNHDGICSRRIYYVNTSLALVNFISNCNTDKIGRNKIEYQITESVNDRK